MLASPLEKDGSFGFYKPPFSFACFLLKALSHGNANTPHVVA